MGRLHARTLGGRGTERDLDLQLARPEWRCYADYDAAQAIRTRWDFYARYAGTDVLVIGTHFAPPTAGRIVRDGDRYRLD